MLALVVVAVAACSPDDVAVDQAARDGARAADGPASVTDPVGSRAAAPSSASPPGLNPLEARIIEALASSGVSATTAERSPTMSASIMAVFDGGTELLVFAHHGGGNDGGGFSVFGERPVGGITVQEVEYVTAPGLRHRFECESTILEVWESVPPGFNEFDDFLATFIDALDC